MRVITLTLVLFMFLGINATCRTPTPVVAACNPDVVAAIDCEPSRDAK
jgi:hypothetical protein